MAVTTDSRRHRVAVWSDRVGLTRLLGSLPQRRRLIVLNYHRIGDFESAAYDPGVFSATREDFDAQVAYLKARVGILTLDESLDWLDRPSSRRGAGILITFDDGYIDNYTAAFPILRAHGVSGTFFLATSFVGTKRLPWWDRIAHYVRRTTVAQFRLDYPTPVTFDLRYGSGEVVRSLVRLYKSPRVIDPERYLRAIGLACQVPEPVSPDRMFLDWTEAAEMIAGGMCIGSHTHTHELLSKFTFDGQLDELTRSRKALQDALHIKADVMAYPVGSKTAFSTTTFAALEHAGYRAAFSYYGGINQPGHTARYDIQRIPVDSDLSMPLFRLRGALAAVVGHELI